MTFEHNYYAILGVPADADARAIKRAYRQLARRYHPDTSSEPDAAERFRDVQEAYELLTDPLQRQAFDHWQRQEGLDQDPPLQIKVTSSQTALASLHEDQVLYVLVELVASSELEGKQLPLNLALVLDRSTSMKGARLQQVKEAARYIVDQLGPEDILSVVTFSDRAQVVLPATRNAGRAATRGAINGIYTSGGTELLQGLEAGLSEVENWNSADVNSHLVLLTDGRTYGDETGCLEAAQHARQQQIPLTMMGVGYDWNDQLLDEMADISLGTSVFIDSSAQIAESFRSRIESLGSIVAHSMRLTLHLGEDVSLREAHRVAPVINRVHLLDDTISLGSLEQKQPQAILLELILGSHTPGEHRLLQVGLEAIVPTMGRQLIRSRQEVLVEFHSNLDQRTPVPSDIVSAMGKLTIFKMQERAMGEIEMGQIEPAVNRLKTLATRLLDIGETELARAALLEAGQLARTGSLSTKGLKTLRYGTRGLASRQKEVQHD